MTKRYYWLKLKDNFFEEEDIRLLEDMDNGKDYVIFLLKLRLKAINTNGYLNFKGLMPYNEKMLATITHTNIDIVRSALKIFTEIGLITRMDDGTLYMQQVEELTGSEGASAGRMRIHRDRLQELPEKASHGDSNVQNSGIDIDIEKEKEKESTPAFFSDTSLEMKMTNYMIEQVIKNYPAARVPDTPAKLHKWCLTFDRIMRIDKRTVEEIREVMKWIFNDEFWCDQVRSPHKLREKWETVCVQMRKKQKKTGEIKQLRPGQKHGESDADFMRRTRAEQGGENR